MALGPVFLIYGGDAQQRARQKDVLIEMGSQNYPCWTETCDSRNGNTTLVFGTTMKDAWSVSANDIYDHIMDGKVEKFSEPPLIRKIEAAENSGGISCKRPLPDHVMAFGGSRYP